MTHFHMTEEQELKDVELRAPLPPEHCCSNHPLPPILPSLLCRMFVACKVLQVGNETRFTALVLLHRYASNFNREEKVNWKWVAAACLFLACKTEEEPRRMRDVINVSCMLQFDNDGEKLKIDVEKEPPELDERYWESKEHIVSTEQAVLRILKFDVLVSHPHRCVVLLAEEVSSDPKLVRVAWRRLNDALFYAPALRFGALTLACAALYLAIVETQQTENDKEKDSSADLVASLGLIQHWSQAYGVSLKELMDAKTSLMQAAESHKP